MDLLNIQMGTHKLDCDFVLCTKPEFHMYSDKDPNTFGLYMLCPKDILNLQHIQVYMLVDYPYNWVGKNKRLVHLLYDTDYLVHKEMDDTGL